jgi:hypothetical protein
MYLYVHSKFGYLTLYWEKYGDFIHEKQIKHSIGYGCYDPILKLNSKHYTKKIVFGVTNSIGLGSILIVNCLCSVTNTQCKLKIVCHSL